MLSHASHHVLTYLACAYGTGTYKVEVWRKGAYDTHFFLGVSTHPNALPLGMVMTRLAESSAFLHAISNGTPAQPHLIYIDADQFRKV